MKRSELKQKALAFLAEFEALEEKYGLVLSTEGSEMHLATVPPANQEILLRWTEKGWEAA